MDLSDEEKEVYKAIVEHPNLDQMGIARILGKDDFEVAGICATLMDKKYVEQSDNPFGELNMDDLADDIEKIYLEIVANPSMNQDQVAKRLNMDVAKVKQICSKMIEIGILERKE